MDRIKLATSQRILSQIDGLNRPGRVPTSLLPKLDFFT
jgi:hypothetical protein